MYSSRPVRKVLSLLLTLAMLLGLIPGAVFASEPTLVWHGDSFADDSHITDTTWPTIKATATDGDVTISAVKWSVTKNESTYLADGGATWGDTTPAYTTAVSIADTYTLTPTAALTDGDVIKVTCTAELSGGEPITITRTFTVTLATPVISDKEGRNVANNPILIQKGKIKELELIIDGDADGDTPLYTANEAIDREPENSFTVDFADGTSDGARAMITDKCVEWYYYCYRLSVTAAATVTEGTVIPLTIKSLEVPGKYTESDPIIVYVKVSNKEPLHIYPRDYQEYTGEGQDADVNYVYAAEERLEPAESPAEMGPNTYTFTYETCDGTPVTSKPKDVGTYTVITTPDADTAKDFATTTFRMVIKPFDITDRIEELCATKTYDGTTNFDLAQLNTPTISEGDDTLNVTGLTAAYDAADVSSNRNLTITAITLEASAGNPIAANYAINGAAFTFGVSQPVNIIGNSSRATINKKNITLGSGNYTGDLIAGTQSDLPAFALDGLCDADSAHAADFTVTYSNVEGTAGVTSIPDNARVLNAPNAGTVTATVTATLGDSLKDNYDLTGHNTRTMTLTVKKQLSAGDFEVVSATNDKTYDGTDALPAGAQIQVKAGSQADGKALVFDVTGTYAGENVGTDKALTFASAAVNPTGSAANWATYYVVPADITGLTGSIAERPVTVAIKESFGTVNQADLTKAATYLDITLGTAAPNESLATVFPDLIWDETSSSYQSETDKMTVAFYKLKAGVTTPDSTDDFELIGATAPTAGTYYVIVGAPSNDSLHNYNVTGFAAEDGNDVTDFKLLTVPAPPAAPSGSRDEGFKFSTTVSNGVAAISITDRNLKKASGNVTMDLSKKKETVNAVVIPDETFSKLTERAKSVELDMSRITVSLDKDAMSSVAKQGGDVSIQAGERTKSVLPAAAQSLIVDNAPVYELSLKAGAKDVREVDGTATVKVPYVLDTGKDARFLVTWCMVDGKPQPIPCQYDPKNQTASFETDTFAPHTIAYFPFDDVVEDGWYYGAVANAYTTDLMDGTGEHIFEPDSDVSRGMLVTMLYSLENKPPVSAPNPFNDNSTNAWFNTAVRWAADQKIASGNDDGTFGPDDSITREDLTVILYGYAKQKGYSVSASADLSSFKDDEHISSYAVTAMRWANANGIIKGKEDNALDPTGYASRAEIATVMRAFALKFSN